MDDPLIPCKHPPAMVRFENYGLNAKCDGCGRLVAVPRDTIPYLMALPAKTGHEGGMRPAGPSMEDVVAQAARLDFALRQMGRAFWHMDHSPKQELAMQVAQDAMRGFDDVRNKLQPMLNRIAALFPGAHFVEETNED